LDNVGSKNQIKYAEEPGWGRGGREDVNFYCWMKNYDEATRREDFVCCNRTMNDDREDDDRR
jgi:hypothetical protein